MQSRITVVLGAHVVKVYCQDPRSRRRCLVINRGAQSLNLYAASMSWEVGMGVIRGLVLPSQRGQSQGS